MVPGVVVRVRVNPSTSVSVLDVLESVGIDYKDKSFATCVSTALNVLIATAKQSGLLPEPDPYDYLNRMKHHVGEQAPDRRKLSKKNVGTLNPLIFPTDTVPDLGKGKWLKDSEPPTAEAIAERVRQNLGVTRAVEVSTSTKELPKHVNGVPTDPMEKMEFDAARLRLTSAQIKKDSVGVDGVLWSEKDEADYQRDLAIAYKYC